MPKKKSAPRSISIMFLLINTVVWGAALPISKVALTHLTGFEFLFYRFLIAGMLSLPILGYFFPVIKNKFSTILTIVVLELIGTTLALGLLYTGLSLTSAIDASLIATTTPLFTTIAGIWYLKEKQDTNEWIGLGFALLGTLILVIEPIFKGGSLESGTTFGNFLIILQNITIAAYYVLAKKHYQKIPKFFVTSISFIVGAISFYLLSNFPILQSLSPTTYNLPLTSNLTVILPILYMAIFGSIIGLTAYIKGQDGIEASEASLFMYLQPLIYIPISVIFLKESISLPMMVAMGLIACGVFVAERKR